MKLRLALGVLALVGLLGCLGSGDAAKAPPPPDHHISSLHKNPSSTQSCDEAVAFNVVFMDESKRQELERQLENDGLVFVSMPTCGEPEPVRDCHVTATYKLSNEMSSTISRVRSESQAEVFAFAKEARSAFPEGYDLATQTATFLLDGKSLGNDPTGSGCGQATHVITAGLIGSFRVVDPNKPPTNTDSKSMRKGGDPEACKSEGVRSKDCRALVAVNLRPLHDKAAKSPKPSEHEQTGIIAPH